MRVRALASLGYLLRWWGLLLTLTLLVPRLADATPVTPIGFADEASTPYGTPVTIYVLENDADVAGASDCALKSF